MDRERTIADPRSPVLFADVHGVIASGAKVIRYGEGEAVVPGSDAGGLQILTIECCPGTADDVPVVKHIDDDGLRRSPGRGPAEKRTVIAGIDIPADLG